MDLKDVLHLVETTETPQIRAGSTHHFNDIWMVVADSRIFCRQYSFGEHSWYDLFLKDPQGAIRCGEVVIPIEAHVPADLDAIGSMVNAAYLEKYAKRFTSYPEIAKEMTGPRFMARTMELRPVLG